MQLFTLEDKSKVEIRIGAAHTGCNTKSTSTLGGLKPLHHTTAFANEQLPSVAEREQNRRLCFHSNPSCGPRRRTVQIFGILLRLVPQVNGSQRQELVPAAWVSSAKAIRAGSSVLIYSFANIRSHLTPACLFTHSPMNPTLG